MHPNVAIRNLSAGVIFQPIQLTLSVSAPLGSNTSRYHMSVRQWSIEVYV